MFKIMSVCNCGIGTSAFSRGLVLKVLEELNYDLRDFKVECTEVMGIRGVKADVLITQKTLLPKMPEPDGKLRGVIGLTSLVKDKEGLMEQLVPILEQAEAEGLIHKKQ